MNARCKQGGFSLIEILVALVILSFGLLAVAQLQVAAIRTLAASRHMTAATYLGEQQLEFLRSLPMPPPPLEGQPPPSPIDYQGNLVVDANGKSVLLDDSAGHEYFSMGDGQETADWLIHPNNPLNEIGDQAGHDDMKYYIRWKVERGSFDLIDQYDPTTGKIRFPGHKQAKIRLQVIWWDQKSHSRCIKPEPVDLDSLDLRTVRSTCGHHIELITVRQADL